MFKKKFINKKVLLVKVAQKGPLDSSSQKNWPGGQRDQERGVVLHVQEEVYWLTLTFRRRVAKYQRVSMRCPKFINYDVSPKKLTGGWQDQGHQVVHHNQREGPQQPKSFRNGSVSVPQGVKEVSHLGPKFHIFVRNRYNTIRWAWPNQPPV